jgi:hypothetical protein
MKSIPIDEHVFIAGKTGSGKSVLAEVYLAGFDTPVIMLDTKGQVYERRKKNKELWYGLEEGVEFTVCETFDQLLESETMKNIYVPIPEEQTQESYERFFKYCYDHQDVTIWIDELMSIAESPLKYPFHLKAIYTRGRSRNTSIWACTQRPMDIPVIAISNSTHFFIFRLQQPQDRKKIVDVTGCTEFEQSPTGHNFWYFVDGWDEPVMAKLNYKPNERG